MIMGMELQLKSNIISMESNKHFLGLTYQQYQQNNQSLEKFKLGDYVILKEIKPPGNYGKVFMGMKSNGAKAVAVKVLDLAKISMIRNKDLRKIRQRLSESQSQLMLKVNSEHIIKCYDVFQNNQLKIIVMQYCNGGTLKDQLKKRGRIPEEQAILILKQLINAIAQMHRHKIIHRDIKPDNIMIHNGVYKLVDFGFSKQMSSEDQIRQTMLGTVTTMAPQVVMKKPYGMKADIWSLGVIFFTMVFGKLPFSAKDYESLKKQINQFKIYEKQQIQFNNYKASKEVSKFLQEILRIETKERLGWKQLLKHEIFQRSDIIPDKLIIDVDLKIDEHFCDFDGSDGPQEALIRDSYKPKGQPKYLKRVDSNLCEKMNLRESTDDAIFKWAKQKYIECKKTQMIFKEIVLPIIQNQLLDLSQRKVIQLIYLLLSRCKTNINYIQLKLKQDKEIFLFNSFMNTVRKLYQAIKIKWQQYDAKLFKKQQQIGQRFMDGLKRIFSNSQYEKKNHIFNGLQNLDYTKQQKAQFTFQKYIKEVLNEINQKKGPHLRRVKRCLQKYVQLNAITWQQCEQKQFYDIVEAILK